MRPNNSNNRRSRGRGGRKSGNSRNQTFDSNGPGARVRGNASQIYEKYQQLARDAASSGDRVGAENFLQHAEHYYRLMIANGPKPEQRSGAEDSPREDSTGDDNALVEAEEESVEAKDNDMSEDEGESDADSLPESLKPNGKGSRANGKRRRPRKADDADADAGASESEPASDEEAEASPA